jgi:hypothetical protein
MASGTLGRIGCGRSIKDWEIGSGSSSIESKEIRAYIYLFIYLFYLVYLVYLFIPESVCEGFFVKKQPLYYIFTPSHLQIYIFTPSHLLI